MDKCSNKTVTSNATINAFMEANKLTLAHKTCSKIHIGKDAMNVQNKCSWWSNETYLGDVISEDGKLDAQIFLKK